jgi:hypothetical protein
MENSADIFENKLFNSSNENKELLNKLLKFLDLLTQIETASNDKIILQLNELNDVKKMSSELITMFDMICENLI